MRLNKSFVKHTMDGVTLVVPVTGARFHGLAQGNKTVGVILDCLENDVTENEIVDVLYGKFDGERSQMASDVADVISRLKEIGAIDE